MYRALVCFKSIDNTTIVEQMKRLEKAINER